MFKKRKKKTAQQNYAKLFRISRITADCVAYQTPTRLQDGQNVKNIYLLI